MCLLAGAGGLYSEELPRKLAGSYAQKTWTLVGLELRNVCWLGLTDAKYLVALEVPWVME